MAEGDGNKVFSRLQVSFPMPVDAADASLGDEAGIT
jgi:hypothetical protein